MMEVIFSDEVKDHPNWDDTWKLADDEIEDKIKELRKEIYKLQKSRKNQPKLVVFRKANLGEGPWEAHIFDGWQVMDVKEGLFCADSWHRITPQEAEYLKKKYKLTDKAIKVIDDTLKRGNN